MVWQKYRIEDKRFYRAQIGPLLIWVKREFNDWYLATKRQAEIADLTPFKKIPDEDLPAELEWARWVVNEKTPIVHMIPVMPDRPLIIRPEIPVHIPQGNFGQYFVNIPLWVKLEVGETRTYTLCELPVQRLSNSWFGDVMSGELCYSKKSLVRRDVESLDKSLCYAVCSVNIHNNSRAVLNFERFCLTVENLSIFGGRVRFWTNPVKVIFHGEDQLSQISISRGRPDQATGSDFYVPPRKAIDDNLLRKSFEFIKNLATF